MTTIQEYLCSSRVCMQVLCRIKYSTSNIKQTNYASVSRAPEAYMVLGWCVCVCMCVCVCVCMCVCVFVRA